MNSSGGSALPSALPSYQTGEYFHFVPSNPALNLALVVGRRVESDIALPIKPHLEGRGIDFAHGSVTAIDADRSRILVGESQELSYDSILIACLRVERLKGKRLAVKS